jgi:hypothetical protein
VEHPTAEVERLRHYLVDFGPAWSSWVPRPESLRQPSATSFRRKSGTPLQWIDSWSGTYEPATLAEVQRIIESEHLGGLYGASPTPLVAGASAIDTVRRSRNESPQS